MKLQVQFSPDPVPPAGPKKVVSKSGIPTKDMDFLETAKKVKDTWLATPGFTLIWTNSTDFETLVNDYGTNLLSRKSIGGARPSQTKTLKNLDKSIDDAVKKVKIYITSKFEENAESEYSRYGLVHKRQHYEFPKDHQTRFNALDMMIAAIATDGFGAKPFGTAFWTAMKTDYKAALKAASDTDGSVSGKVATKTQQKAEIKKVFKALRSLIDANYPTTYKSIYRVWGWQKEDY